MLPFCSKNNFESKGAFSFVEYDVVRRRVGLEACPPFFACSFSLFTICCLVNFSITQSPFFGQSFFGKLFLGKLFVSQIFSLQLFSGKLFFIQNFHSPFKPRHVFRRQFFNFIHVVYWSIQGWKLARTGNRDLHSPAYLYRLVGKVSLSFRCRNWSPVAGWYQPMKHICFMGWCHSVTGLVFRQQRPAHF